MNNAFSQELEEWLHASSDRYVVERTLKQTPQEVTEVVYIQDEQGRPSQGPFVRKRFDRNAGRGRAYETLLDRQIHGARLTHQPLLYECRRQGDFFEVIMEYVPGMTLRDLVLEQGPGIEVATSVMPRLCDAVSELHESFDSPLIHRDIKPSNVMICGDRLVLIDLGIARTYVQGADRDTVRYGTPGYAPPEQFGYGQTSTLSDVYALGMTLAFCLTGEDPTTALRNHAFADPRIPPQLRDVLVRATEFDPKRRHQSARALRTDFEHAIESLSGHERKEPLARQATGRKILTQLGRIWNVLLTLVWLFMAFSCFAAFTRPSEESLKYPVWFRLLEIVGLVFIPWSLGYYALLDKRRLRAHEPFCRFNWRIELAVCLLGIVLIMVFVVVVHQVLFVR